MIVWPRPSRPASRRQPYRPRRARAATRDARPGWPHDDVATLRRRASRRQPRFSILTDDHRLDGQFDTVNAAVVRASCCIALSLVERPVVRADAAQRGRAALLSGPRAGWRARGPAAGRPRARPRGLRWRKARAFRCSLFPCPRASERKSEHRRGSPGQGAQEGASAGNQAHTGRCGRAFGQRSEHRRGAAARRPPRGFRRRRTRTIGIAAVGRPPRASGRCPPPLTPPTSEPHLEYRRQASAPGQTPRDPRLGPPHGHRARAGRHAPPAPPWRPRRDAETATAKLRTSASRPRMSAPSDEIHSPDIVTPGPSQKPVQHRRAAPKGPAGNARIIAPQIGTIRTPPMCACKT